MSTMQRIVCKYYVIYVPDHAGISYNERVDALANTAMPLATLKQKPADIISVVARKQADNSSDTFSMSRLVAAVRKRGEGASLTTRGLQARQIRNQQEFGVLSRRTLKDLLRPRADVWGPVQVNLDSATT